MTTSFTRLPSALGLLHFQQNPAAIRAEFLFSAFLALTSVIMDAGSSKIRNSILGSNLGNSIDRIPSALSSHWRYASEPEQRN